MRIVNYHDFCRMPAGTVFAPFTPCVLEEGLAIKVDSGEDVPKGHPLYDYCSHTFNGVMPLRPWLGDDCGLWGIGAQEDASFEIYDGDYNDYHDYKMFLIFEEADIDRMIKALIWAKNGCIGDCNCSTEVNHDQT